MCSTLQQVPASQYPEYHYSLFLARNYTVLTAVIFFIAGILIGYFLKLNPWLSGICLILVLPVASVCEIVLDSNSHNLFPFELIVYFVFALPPVAGTYFGRFLLKRTTRTKG